MQILFSEIAQVRDFITVDISSDLRTIKPYIYQAENRFIKEIIGKDLLEILRTYVENPTPADPDKDALLEKVRYPLINYAYRFSSDRLNVNISDRGMTVLNTDSEVPAAEWRITNVKDEFLVAAGDGAEDLIEFLEDNKAAYPEWETSDAYSFQKRYFINNAEDVKRVTGKEMKRMHFIKHRQDLNLFETEKIEAVTCTDLFDRLKTTIKDGGATPEEQILLDKFIVPACSWFMLAITDKNEYYKGKAKKEVQALRVYLNENVATYPLFQNSSCYEEGVTPIFPIDQNNEDSPIFLM